MESINLNLCRSVQSKNNINIQCNNKPKNDNLLCGKHCNSKKIIYYNIIELNINNTDNLVVKDDKDDKADKIIYSKEQLFEIVINDKPINIYSLRKSIKNCGYNKIINTKQSKNILINSLKKIIIQERFYLNNEQSIVTIQKYFRKWLVLRRKYCINDTDILTFISKYDIEEKYFYIFYDNVTKKKYAYDIRTLAQILNSEYKSCPYTFRLFNDYEKEKISNYINTLIINNIDIDIEKKVLTFEEETNMKIKDIFYEINMLDNYTDPEWFKELSLFNLMELYLKMEDIWNYRSSMTLESKQRIVKNGIVFNIPPNIIKYQKNKLKLQNVILDEFKRMISEGINRDEKKLGAILILTGLVEVSSDAANALPHLIQI